jgi:hypothetical protein
MQVNEHTMKRFRVYEYTMRMFLVEYTMRKFLVECTMQRFRVNAFRSTEVSSD